MEHCRLSHSLPQKWRRRCPRALGSSDVLQSLIAHPSAVMNPSSLNLFHCCGTHLVQHFIFVWQSSLLPFQCRGARLAQCFIFLQHVSLPHLYCHGACLARHFVFMLQVFSHLSHCQGKHLAQHFISMQRTPSLYWRLTCLLPCHAGNVR